MLTRIKETKIIGFAQDLKKGTSNSTGIKQEPLSQLTQFETKYLLYLWQVPYLSLQMSSTRYCLVLCNEYTTRTRLQSEMVGSSLHKQSCSKEGIVSMRNLRLN